ncbi:hypothetical protein [Effusibacillus lacus]|uniref:Rhodanese domain-containing protein n=1 Tax=Effusibacillus lacus TaxID=1348429 RepID=A0A292YQW0_9BACL|nr:hypothetical protein [Effusibacillus lacus]TCS74902.1 hypothetical protein EDD64_11026 [Effusibacillus lacus]GAX91576.1 hypothetical protein EFBL_3266 [Effusibacillus lacus]
MEEKGIRSSRVMLYLLQNGFTDVTNALGGMAEIERHAETTGTKHLLKKGEL